MPRLWETGSLFFYDYDNDGNYYDYIFVTFDDFGVKNDQKVYT